MLQVGKRGNKHDYNDEGGNFAKNKKIPPSPFYLCLRNYVSLMGTW